MERGCFSRSGSHVLGRRFWLLGRLRWRSDALKLTHPTLVWYALNSHVHRLVVTKKGWTESNEAGDFIEQGEWPRQMKRAVRFSLNKHFELSFENRQNITITYKVRARPHDPSFRLLLFLLMSPLCVCSQLVRL